MTMGMDLARRLTNPGLPPFWKEVKRPRPGRPSAIRLGRYRRGRRVAPLSSVVLGAAVSPVSTESSPLPASAPLPIGQRAELRKCVSQQTRFINGP